MIFQSSTWLTELITSGKYAEYANYQRGVGMFFPKSVRSYQAQIAQPAAPKVIRTSEIAKKMQRTEKQKQKQK